MTHQSVVAMHAAQQSIDNKLAVLRAWSEHGVPTIKDNEGREILDRSDCKILEYFPTSLRQFKLWNGSQNTEELRKSLPPFKATGNDTLSKRPICEEVARKLLSAVSARAQSQNMAGSHVGIKKLRAEVAALKAALSSRISELREQQRAIRQLQLRNSALNSLIDRERLESQHLLSEVSKELEIEKVRNSELAASSSKIQLISHTKFSDRKR